MRFIHAQTEHESPEQRHKDNLHDNHKDIHACSCEALWDIACSHPINPLCQAIEAYD